MLGGWAIGTTGLFLHHAVCQTIVRTAGTPHAETNAVMLPHSLRFVAPRAPDELARLALALGAGAANPALAAERAAPLAARSGKTRLTELGVREEDLDAIVDAALGHRVFADGGAPARGELRALVEAAM